MSKGGYRPNSGRKKGSIPWNRNIPMREESKLKLSQSLKGKEPWNKGIHSGYYGTGFKKGCTGYRKGITVSKETKEKMRLAKLGKPSNWKGRKASLETREKLSNSHKVRLKKLNPNYIPYLRNSKYDNARRKRKTMNGGFHSIGEWERLKAQYNWTCPSCKKIEPEIKLTRDHIIAISIGGSDNIENIQPLCVECNSHKNIHTIKY